MVRVSLPKRRPALAGILAGILAGLPAPLGAAPPPAPDTLPPVDRILARYVQAVGGAEALARLETRHLTGREVDDRPYRGPAHVKALEGVARHPDRWSLTWTDTVVERSWSDGTGTWRSIDGESAASGAEVRSKESFLLDPRGPLRVADYFPGLRVAGREERSGRDVWVLHSDLDPTYNALAFEVESGLLVQIGWYWTLEDYRAFDGVLLPTRIVGSRKGGSTTVIWDTVVHDRPVDPRIFDPPGT